MVTVQYQGRLGNRLTQYTYARLVSEILGHEFIAPPIEEFPDLVVRCKGGGLNATDGILVKGYFEEARLYALVRERIVKWFLKPSDLDVITTSIAVHVRGGDALEEGFRCPPYSYYKKAIEIARKRCQGEWLTIFTDDPQCLVVKALLQELDCDISLKSPIEDLKYILSHQQIIIGNSTFAWWAAFLSGHNNIIQPEPSKGWRSKIEPNSCLLIDEWTHIPYHVGD